jgi:hypothetical protein
MSRGWKIITINIIYNIFDTIGRFTPHLKRISESSYYILIFFRFIFVLVFPVIVAIDRTSIFEEWVIGCAIIFFLSLYAFTNGYTLSLAFFYARKDIPDQLKGLAGSTLSFFLNLGRYAGSIYAILVIKSII